MIDRPLKPQWFQILLALSTEDRHGYGIQRAVLDQTDGHMRLWPTMLYRSLSRLAEAGLISQVDAPAQDLEDERRQYYALTKAGRALLAEEARLLARWAEAALGAEL
jgi:DNA-binding PadR family transcriptional regulator